MLETLWLHTFQTSLQRSCATSRGRTTETTSQRSTETSLGVSFETSMRRREDLPMVCHCYVVTTFLNDVVETYHRDVLSTFHQGVVGCYIWDVPATLLRRIKILSALVFLVMKIKWNIQFVWKQCFEKRYWFSILKTILIGEEGKKYYVLIKNFNTLGVIIHYIVEENVFAVIANTFLVQEKY